MEALHRLAGVQDASDLSASQTDRSTHVADVPVPPVPSSDPDVRGSRASLPLNRKASHKSFKSGKSARSARSYKTSSAAGNSGLPSPGLAPSNNSGVPVDYPPSPHIESSGFDQDDAAGAGARRSQDSGSTAPESGEDEFTWGPTHPCFPHINPHCDPDSEEASNTKVIRVKRDWLVAGDLYPQYANLYPEILDPLVSDEEFRFLISNLNAQLKRVFDPFTMRARVDSVLGVLTGYLWDDVGLAGTKTGMRGVERFLAEWNEERVKQGRAVKVVLVRTTGFMSLDFIVPVSCLPFMEDDDEDDDEERAEEE